MRSRLRRLVILVAVVTVGTAVSCAADPTIRNTTSASGTTLKPETTATVSGGTVITRPRPSTVTATAAGAPAGTIETRHLLDGFKEVTITVTTAEGKTLQWCLLLADTEPARARGLMFVSDPNLGGYDGMLFSFGENVSGGFWMKNTILPLSLAYLNAEGATVSTVDMAPCPADTKACPNYPSGGRYRHAIEVPQGELARLGIAERSIVHIGPEGCASAAFSENVTGSGHTGE